MYQVIIQFNDKQVISGAYSRKSIVELAVMLTVYRRPMRIIKTPKIYTK